MRLLGFERICGAVVEEAFALMVFVSEPDGGTADSSNQLMQYIGFLHKQTLDHYDYLHHLLTFGATVVGGIIAIVASLLTWFGWKTMRDARAEIRLKVDEIVEKQVPTAVEQFTDTIRMQEKQFEERAGEQTRALEEKRRSYEEQFDHLKAELGEQVQALRKTIDRHAGDVANLVADRKAGLTGMPSRALDGKKSPRILWVDDVPDNNLIPSGIFQQIGLEITTAESTEEALELLRTQPPPGLVISDMGRGTNRGAGLDLLRALREERIEVPVIIYASARAIERYGKQAKELGAIDCINGVSRLLDRVYDVLNIDPKS